MTAVDSHATRATGRIVLAMLILCLSATLLGRNLPVVTADAATDRFSADRARTVVTEIARAPHPVESEEIARVRAFLLEHLRTLGYAPQEQRGEINGVQLTNLLARIPGSAPTGTLLLLAHYDTVPRSPGAGDDSIGVACWLETLRALRVRGWRPKNDVVLLLTDGEERGMYGARLFRSERAWMQSIACVINLEAIGNGGPAVLFQLGAGNGACVRAFGRSVAAPTGTSLGDAIYRRMPNNTDLTPFLERDIAGFNLAITSGSTAYHAPHDTPANLDPRSVQHMGECALSLAEHLAGADLRALHAADVTFFDVLGYGLVRYSKAWDAVLAVFGCALACLACRRARASARELAGHALRHLLEIALVAAGIALSWWLVDSGVALFTPAPDWVPGNTTSGALLFAAAVALTAGYELMRGSARARPSAAQHEMLLDSSRLDPPAPQHEMTCDSSRVGFSAVQHEMMRDSKRAGTSAAQSDTVHDSTPADSAAARRELVQGSAHACPSAARAGAIALLWSAAALASLQWLPGASFAFAWPLILATLGTLATTRRDRSPAGEALLVVVFALALLLGLPILYLVLQLFQRSPLPAVALTSAALASASGLLALPYQRVGRDVSWARNALLCSGVLALLAAVVVARALAWRQGALLP